MEWNSDQALIATLPRSPVCFASFARRTTQSALEHKGTRDIQTCFLYLPSFLSWCAFDEGNSPVIGEAMHPDLAPHPIFFQRRGFYGLFKGDPRSFFVRVLVRNVFPSLSVFSLL